jgi:DNA-directed RNA polymerase subunit M/transcription elongation factor TFIIS
MTEDETRFCPSCGSELIESEDNDGRWYQCPNLECLELYAADEIEEDEL